MAPRKNATLGIEIVASLPAGLLIDHLAYFRDTAAWAQQHYRVPLLSAIVHNDESSPHLHLVLLPVRDGKLVGSELLGNRATMKAMQKDFHEQVAKQYGLRMPAAKKRHSAAQRAAGIALLRDTLQANSGLTERAIDALLFPHAKNPEPLLVALGLAMPAPVVKGSFVETMTRKVRPESPDKIYKKSPIGHLRAQTADGFFPENENSYALLGLPISAPNFPPSANPSSASNSAPGQAKPVHHQASVNAQPDIACPAPGTAQRERSTTSIEQCGTDTGNPASPATAARGQNGTAPFAISQPADNSAMLPDWAMAPRTTASPGKTGMALSTVCSTVEAIAVERSQQQVGQQSDHDADLASTAPTKRATAKRQARTVTAALATAGQHHAKAQAHRDAAAGQRHAGAGHLARQSCAGNGHADQAHDHQQQARPGERPVRCRCRC